MPANVSRGFAHVKMRQTLMKADWTLSSRWSPPSIRAHRGHRAALWTRNARQWWAPAPVCASRTTRLWKMAAVQPGTAGTSSLLCVWALLLPPLAVSLGRRVPAVQHGAGGHVAQQPVHPLRVLADLHHQLGSVHREEHVRQLRPGDPGQIFAEGERPLVPVCSVLVQGSCVRPKLNCWFNLRSFCTNEDANKNNRNDGRSKTTRAFN